MICVVCVCDAMCVFVCARVCVCMCGTVEYSQVDWHEFVLVETINFRETETGKFI